MPNKVKVLGKVETFFEVGFRFQMLFCLRKIGNKKRDRGVHFAEWKNGVRLDERNSQITMTV